jgi:hypothetical protein
MVGFGMTRQSQKRTNQRSETETEGRRDEAIKRALRTPPISLEELKKLRKPKPSAPSSKKR